MFPYDAILLDAGGTLLVRQPADADVLASRCAVAGIAVDGDAVAQAWNRAEAWACRQILREVAGASRMPDAECERQMDLVAMACLLGEPGAADVAAARLQSVERPPQVWLALDGAERTLAELKAHGYRLAVVSNFDASLPGLLSSFGLSTHLDATIVSAEVGIEKPDPAILRLACERLGVDPGRAIYVGDHPLDVLCAKEAGMAVAWVRGDDDALPAAVAYEPDYRIGSVNDLVELAVSQG